MNMKKQAWRAAILAAAIAVSVALPSFAATNITSNVTLTEDTDWTEFGTVTLGETRRSTLPDTNSGRTALSRTPNAGIG